MLQSAPDPANLLIPIALMLLAIEPWLQRRDGIDVRAILVYFARCMVAVGGAATLAQLGKSLPIWPGHPGFPSGHMSFATAVAGCLWLHRRGVWRLAAVGLALIMAADLVRVTHHTPGDLLGGLILGSLMAALAFWRASPRR